MTTMEGKSIFRSSAAPSSRSMFKSFVLHAVFLLLLLFVPARTMLRSQPPKKNIELDNVFHRPAPVEIPAPKVPVADAREMAAGGSPRAGAPAPASKPKPNAEPGPDRPGRSELPPGPVESQPVDEPPRQKVGNAGILAFKDKIASLAQDKVAPRLGADARYGAADDVGRSSSRSNLATNMPGSSGGINTASLNRSVGGGGGGGGGGGTGGGGRGGTGTGGGGNGGGGSGGVGVGRATSSITGVGGADRPKARAGAGAARTDEEIQIVFDRYKASFYRLYNRELRNSPTLQGQMILKLTIEPDGSVSMCVLQSSDMDAPDLAAQVVARVKQMNFGAKEVPAVTIVYPIDFLPAG